MLSRIGALVVAMAAALSVAALLWHTPLGGATGNIITSPDTAGSVGLHTSLALDAGGNPVVSYRSESGGDLKVLHCGDANCISGNSITSPDTTDDVGFSTSLVLDASGNPVVGYFNTTSDDLKVLHCGDPNCSAGNVITSPDTSGSVGSNASLALDGSGYPVVSYYDSTNKDLKVLHCGDPNCTAGNVITSPDAADDVGRFTSVALDAGGNPVVSYTDDTNSDLKVLHCGDATCSAGNVITSPDTAGSVGFHTSLALDGGGNPVVAYTDLANLKILHCGDPNCSSGNVITSPDTSGDVGWHNSLALDGSGNPVVSYYDSTNKDLKVLHCGDPNCSAGNVITSPDTAGAVGRYTSLALDGSGNPVVSYLDDDGDGDRDLKVLHCGDPNCSPPPTPTPTATPSPSPTPSPTPTSSPTPTPTATPPAGEGVIWGDSNCSRQVDPVDSLLVLRGDAGLPTNTGDCPDMGQDIEVLDASPHIWGDVDCTGAMTPVDSLKILRFDAGLDVSQEVGCPLIGVEVTVVEG